MEKRDETTLLKVIEDLIREQIPTLRIQRIEQIAGDMSPRRYFRVWVEGGRSPSLVAMVFDSRVVPEAGGEKGVDSFQAVVGLSDYLMQRGIPVPENFVLADHESIILQEDFGDTFLADFLKREGKRAIPLYKSAIDLIIQLQTSQHDEQFFALRRAFTEESYIREMEETRDFYLPWKLGGTSVPQAASEKILTFLKMIAERVAAQRTALSLRDYHSWNLMVREGEQIGVIDFQDALLAPECYDVVALLNDRDTDSLLGVEQYDTLLEYFFQNHPNDLRREYPFVLLQRDLKVAGRLAKMVVQRGLRRYEMWIPGTARRIRRTLERSGERELLNLLDLLTELDPTFGTNNAPL